MSVKHYGIYLAYPPGLDLRHEGLGRYLAAFLKGAEQREDVRFVIVCPSWSRAGLEDLFNGEGVDEERFKVLSPERPPVILRLYERYQARKKKKRSESLIMRLTKAIFAVRVKVIHHVEGRLVKANSYLGLTLGLLEISLFLLLGLVFSPLLIVGLIYLFSTAITHTIRKFFRPYARQIARFRKALGEPKNDVFVQRLYRGMEHVESERMLSMINGLSEVRAWYSPTAFWPAFNSIKGPRLMCVPDVVLTDFPVPFSNIGGQRFVQVFNAVESAIEGGDHFVTYSSAVKFETLVGRYGVMPNNVSVILHAPNDLSRWVTVSGGSEDASLQYSRKLLLDAIKKSHNSTYVDKFQNKKLKFIFYASQFRPNKNLMTLLRAYDYLLKHRFIPHKLLLTGSIHALPEVRAFIARRRLENDVLCLHGLSIQELAACYKLADLAVNPSLSEGGCPFTFTEALSVDTPVVMARIPVTEEVISSPELQSRTLFDPYDWRDMAEKVEWALENRTELYQIQATRYEELAARNWTDVVNEHIAALDQVAGIVADEV